MQRYTVKIEVSLFAYDQEDAAHLGGLLRDRVDGLMGGGQAIVRIAGVAPDDWASACDGCGYLAPTCRCEDSHADEIALQARDDAEFEQQQAYEIAAENAWQLR